MAELGVGENTTVSLTVANVGAREGDEVIMALFMPHVGVGICNATCGIAATALPIWFGADSKALEPKGRQAAGFKVQLKVIVRRGPIADTKVRSDLAHDCSASVGICHVHRTHRNGNGNHFCAGSRHRVVHNKNGVVAAIARAHQDLAHIGRVKRELGPLPCCRRSH